MEAVRNVRERLEDYKPGKYEELKYLNQTVQNVHWVSNNREDRLIQQCINRLEPIVEAKISSAQLRDFEAYLMLWLEYATYKYQQPIM